MDDTFYYLNTDLDLFSADDLTALATALEAQGVFPLHLTHGEDGLWYATFEVEGRHTEKEPEPTIAAMLGVLESLSDSLRLVWSGCTLREFNIGYDCGSKPWAFNQGLSSRLLGRIAAVGASLRITLYPQLPRQNAAPFPAARPGPQLGSLSSKVSQRPRRLSGSFGGKVIGAFSGRRLHAR